MKKNKRNSKFINNLLDRFDRIDKSQLKGYLSELDLENNLLHEILDSLTEGVLVLSSEGRIIRMNKTANKWLGLNENESDFLKIKDEGLRSRLRSAMSGVFERRVEDVHVLNPCEFFIRLYFIPLTATGNHEVLILMTDQSEELAEQADVARLSRIEALLKLAAGVAHEIGNPLNSLSIHLQLLKNQTEKLPAMQKVKFRRGLNVIAAETERMDRIVRNFLKATRKPPLRLKMDDLNRLIEETLDLLKPELDRKKIGFEYKLDKKIANFLFDRDRLYQAVMNLIKNAMESMTSGGMIKIKTSLNDKVAIIQIADQGKGISEDALPHIFDAYFTTKDGGSGLGLMLVYETVAEHGGRIEVESKLDKGTIFTIHLPIRRPKLQLPKYDFKSDQ